MSQSQASPFNASIASDSTRSHTAAASSASHRTSDAALALPVPMTASGLTHPSPHSSVSETGVFPPNSAPLIEVEHPSVMSLVDMRSGGGAQHVRASPAPSSSQKGTQPSEPPAMNTFIGAPVGVSAQAPTPPPPRLLGSAEDSPSHLASSSPRHLFSQYEFPVSNSASFNDERGLQALEEGGGTDAVLGDVLLMVRPAVSLTTSSGTTAAPISSAVLGGGPGGHLTLGPQRFRRLSSSANSVKVGSEEPTSGTTSANPFAGGLLTTDHFSPGASRSHLSPRPSNSGIPTEPLSRMSSLRRSSLTMSDGLLTPLAAGYPLRTTSVLNLMMIPIPTEIGEESLMDLLRPPTSPLPPMSVPGGKSEESLCSTSASTASSLPRRYHASTTVAPTRDPAVLSHAGAEQSATVAAMMAGIPSSSDLLGRSPVQVPKSTAAHPTGSFLAADTFPSRSIDASSDISAVSSAASSFVASGPTVKTPAATPQESPGLNANPDDVVVPQEAASSPRLRIDTGSSGALISSSTSSPSTTHQDAVTVGTSGSAAFGSPAVALTAATSTVHSADSQRTFEEDTNELLDETDQAVERLAGFFVEEAASRLAHVASFIDVVAPQVACHLEAKWRYRRQGKRDGKMATQNGSTGGRPAMNELLLSPTVALSATADAGESSSGQWLDVASPSVSLGPGERPMLIGNSSDFPKPFETPVGVSVDKAGFPNVSPPSDNEYLKGTVEDRIVADSFAVVFSTASQLIVSMFAVYDEVMFLPLLASRDAFPSRSLYADSCQTQAEGDATCAPDDSRPALASGVSSHDTLQRWFPFEDESWIGVIGTARVCTYSVFVRAFYYAVHVQLLSSYRMVPSVFESPMNNVGGGNALDATALARGFLALPGGHSVASIHTVDTQSHQQLPSHRSSRSTSSSVHSPPTLVTSGPATQPPENTKSPSRHNSVSISDKRHLDQSHQRASLGNVSFTSSAGGNGNGLVWRSSPPVGALVGRNSPSAAALVAVIPSLWRATLLELCIGCLPHTMLPEAMYTHSITTSLRNVKEPSLSTGGGRLSWSVVRGPRRESMDSIASASMWLHMQHLGSSGVAHHRASSSVLTSHTELHPYNNPHQYNNRPLSITTMVSQLLATEEVARQHVQDLCEALLLNLHSLVDEMMATVTRVVEDAQRAKLAQRSRRPTAPVDQDAAPRATVPPDVFDVASSDQMSPPRLQSPATRDAPDTAPSRLRMPSLKTYDELLADAAALAEASCDEDTSPEHFSSDSARSEAPLLLTSSRSEGARGFADIQLTISSQKGRKNRSLCHDDDKNPLVPHIANLNDSLSTPLSVQSAPHGNSTTTHTEAAHKVVAARRKLNRRTSVAFIQSLMHYLAEAQELVRTSSSSASLSSPTFSSSRWTSDSCLGTAADPPLGSESFPESYDSGYATVDGSLVLGYASHLVPTPLQSTPLSPTKMVHHKASSSSTSDLKKQLHPTGSSRLPPHMHSVPNHRIASFTPSHCEDVSDLVEQDRAARFSLKPTDACYDDLLLGLPENVAGPSDFVAAIFRLRRRLLIDAQHKEHESRMHILEQESAGRHTLRVCHASPKYRVDLEVYLFVHGPPWREGVTDEDVSRVAVVESQKCLWVQLATLHEEGLQRAQLQFLYRSRLETLRGMYEALFDGYLTVPHQADAAEVLSRDCQEVVSTLFLSTDMQVRVDGSPRGEIHEDEDGESSSTHTHSETALLEVLHRIVQRATRLILSREEWHQRVTELHRVVTKLADHDAMFHAERSATEAQEGADRTRIRAWHEADVAVIGQQSMVLSFACTTQPGSTVLLSGELSHSSHTEAPVTADAVVHHDNVTSTQQAIPPRPPLVAVTPRPYRHHASSAAQTLVAISDAVTSGYEPLAPLPTVSPDNPRNDNPPNTPRHGNIEGNETPNHTTAVLGRVVGAHEEADEVHSILSRDNIGVSFDRPPLSAINQLAQEGLAVASVLGDGLFPLQNAEALSDNHNTVASAQCEAAGAVTLRNAVSPSKSAHVADLCQLLRPVGACSIPIDEAWFFVMVEVQNIRQRTMSMLSTLMMPPATPCIDTAVLEEHVSPFPTSLPMRSSSASVNVSSTPYVSADISTIEEVPRLALSHSSKILSLILAALARYADACSADGSIVLVQRVSGAVSTSTVGPGSRTIAHEQQHRPQQQAVVLYPNIRFPPPDRTKAATLGILATCPDIYMGEFSDDGERQGFGLYEYTRSMRSDAFSALSLAEADAPAYVASDVYVGMWQRGMRDGTGYYVSVKTSNATPQVYTTTIALCDWKADSCVATHWTAASVSDRPLSM